MARRRRGFLAVTRWIRSASFQRGVGRAVRENAISLADVAQRANDTLDPLIRSGIDNQGFRERMASPTFRTLDQHTKIRGRFWLVGMRFTSIRHGASLSRRSENETRFVVAWGEFAWKCGLSADFG